MADQLANDLNSLRIDRGGKKPTRKGLRVVVTLAVLGALGWVGYTRGVPYVESQVFKTEVGLTEIASVSPHHEAVDLTATGYVIPQSTAKVGAKIVGRIVTVNVEEGAAVKTGDVLFELDPDDQRSAVAAAQARVAAASAKIATAKAQKAEIELDYNRTKLLAEEGAVARATVDDLDARLKSLDAQVKAAQAEVTAAQAEVQSLSTGLKNLKIFAPIDGTALTKPANIGDITSPNMPLVELADFSTLLVEVDVPEGRLELVKPDGPCEIALDSVPSKRFPGTVVAISPKLNRAKATAVVKVKFNRPPEQLRPEMSARVSFLEKELDEDTLAAPPKIIVPAAAIVDHAGSKAVWVVEQDIVRRVPVTLGDAFGSGFVIESGPPPGTRVVKNPPEGLADGQAVKEKNAS